ncbi:hypothetical protein [Allomuricauda sp. R78024]|uniref:hypothetical protein n=1 Tax=Allomuricauda sp. R78024 TaxID=3093867 RepID=UPI0037CC6D60
MKDTILIPFIFFIIISAASCDRTKDANTSLPIGYKFFNLEQAGWKSKSASHNLSNIEYTATWVPIQYYIIKNSGNGNPSLIDSIYQSHKDERVIEVEFKHTAKDDLLKTQYTQMDYESAVKYMSFSLEKDFVAITQLGDTINCSGVTFERNFKVAPFKRILLHFGGIPENDQIQLVYHDKLFSNGILKFKFTEKPLKL